MLTGSWALTRSPWSALRRSSYILHSRTYTSAHASLLHANRLPHTPQATDTESTDDVSLQRAITKGDSQAKYEEVFEDYADEYEVIASTSKPPRPSILDTIDSILPAMLPPASTDASSIFEDEASYEYNSITLSSSSKQSLHEAVLGLLAEEKYEDAYKALVEMKHLGHKIHPHHAYEAAALATLDDMLGSTPSQTLTLSDHITRFEMFFSHMPSSRTTDRNRTFKEIRGRILDNSLINMDLIIRFSLILMKKGYVNLVQKHTIPFITRFASSDTCLQFVDDAVVANKQYWLSHHPPDERNAIIQSWNLRSTAIHWLAFSNRIEDAVSLLPRDGLPMDGFRLSSKTHALLRFRLGRSSKPEHHSLTHFVDNLLRGPKNLPVNVRARASSGPAVDAGHQPVRIATGTFSTTMAPTPLNGLIPRVELSGNEDLDGVQLSGPSDSLHTLLKRLKNSYISSLSSTGLFTFPPSLKEVLSFFDSYLSNLPNKDGRAIGLLRRRVLRLGRGPASHFLFAEMLHYHQAGQPNLVIETYVDHFYISGLPRDDVFTHYHQTRARRDAELKAVGTAGKRDFKVPFRSGMRNADSSQPYNRLWPAPSHTSLVWHALAALATDDSSILQLYQKLLQITTEGYSMGAHVKASHDTPLVPPTTWDAKVPASAFTPFIRRMLKTSNPTDAGSIGSSLLGDMVRAGIKPNVHHLTEIAQFYAQRQDSRRAFMIMEQMEAAEGEQNEEPINVLAGDTVSKASFPPPDIVFYCALLRAFIRCRNLADAEKIASRIETRYKTAIESNAFTSGQLEVIEVLRRDLGQLREVKKHEDVTTTRHFAET